jgi:hypothetical protein
VFYEDPNSSIIAEVRGFPSRDLAGQRLELARFKASTTERTSILNPSGLLVQHFESLIRAGPGTHGAPVALFKINADRHINLQVGFPALSTLESTDSLLKRVNLPGTEYS